METTPPAKNSRKRVAAWVVGSLLVLAALAASFWPSLLERAARDQLLDALERRFDVVEVGCFELSRDRAHICDVYLEKEGAVVYLKKVDIEYDIRWLKRQVVISHISSRGGTAQVETKVLEELKASTSDPGGAGSDHLHLKDVQLQLGGINLAARHEGLEMRASINATLNRREGTLKLEMQAVGLLKAGELVASASTVNATLDLKEPFPTQVLVTDAGGRYRGYVVEGVAGTLGFGDAQLRNISMDLHGQTLDGKSWTLIGSMDRVAATVDLVLAAQDLKPSHLPGAAQLPVHLNEGQVSGSISIRGSRKRALFRGEARLDQVVVEHPRLSRDPVVLRHLFRGSGTVDLEAKELLLEEASISSLRGYAWALKLSGRALLAEDPLQRELEAHLRLENAPCQELLEAVPQGLVPALGGFELSGSTRMDLQLVAKMSDPNATLLQGGLDIDSCNLKEVPRAVADLGGPFSHVVRMRDGRTVSRLLGPGAVYFVSYERMPPHLPAAVVATEDGGFWKHDGILENQFEASLRRNIELGKFRRGASTITMQMVKNVLLTHERTLSRKLQELFLTWVVERELSKGRIMEIYLNVVEFGPGIYGVGDAADHYFGKVPLELSSLESAFLATLLPRPLERHEMWCRGELTEKHAKYVHQVHKRMLASNRITQEEFDAAELAGISFSRRGWAGEAACLAEGRRVAAGTHTQGALSGLLLGVPE